MLHIVSALAAICLAFVPDPAQNGAGFSGRSLSDLLDTDFFTRYQLREAGRRPLAAGQDVIVLPSGALNNHVRVILRTDAAGKVRTLEASIDRNFIDADTNVHARDFVRNFLRDAPPAGLHPSLAAFIAELAMASPSEKPSHPYRVFAGTQNAFLWPHRDTVVTLKNGRLRDRLVLLITIEPAADFLKR